MNVLKMFTVVKPQISEAPRDGCVHLKNTPRNMIFKKILLIYKRESEQKSGGGG